MFNINNIIFRGQTNAVNPVNAQPQTAARADFTISEDKFESTNPKRYTSEFIIRKLSGQNPEIKKILNEINIPYQINMDELNKTLEGHCTQTQQIAEGLVKNLPFALESKAHLKEIKDAAYLHDIGKVFIPPEILNKNSKLDDREKAIIQKHSQLGYELLKNTSLNPITLNLIKNHHQDAKGSGYPVVNKNFKADLDLQILSIADKYSALTEVRPYKKALTREEALTIIRADVRNGKFNPLIYNALVNYTDNTALTENKINV